MNQPFYIYGYNQILETLNTNPKQIDKIYFVKDKTVHNGDSIIALAKQNKISLGAMDSYEAGKIAEGNNHQNVLALIQDFKFYDLNEVLNNTDENKLLVILNNITDTHNMGAIIRSAVAFGAYGIIIPKNDSAPLNATVYKASAGTINNIKIIKVTNINQTLNTLKKNKYWIVSLDMNGNNTLNKFDLKDNYAFVIGQEGEGVNKSILENSDFILNIPMTDKAESLNASVSGALFMWEWYKANKL